MLFYRKCEKRDQTVSEWFQMVYLYFLPAEWKVASEGAGVVVKVCSWWKEW